MFETVNLLKDDRLLTFQSKNFDINAKSCWDFLVVYLLVVNELNEANFIYFNIDKTKIILCPN